MLKLKSPLTRYLDSRRYRTRLEVRIMAKGFDWKIGGKKFLVNAAIVILSGLVVVWQEDAKYMALIPVIKMALNYIKHR